MIFFPAIDLKDGNCVRLYQGDMDQATVFSDDPAAQARAFQDAGCEWVHLVDLNGAFEGKPVNAAAVTGILAALDIPVQLGGGIRTMATIDDWLARGVRRVILGTVALTDPDLVKAACKAHPGRVAVGIDARDGRVAVEGWADPKGLFRHLLVTDIGRDGVMQGPNLQATLDLARAVSIPVIASGGVSSMTDLEELKAQGGGLLEGVISGRAVYDGKIDLPAAVKLLKGAA